MKEKVLVAMSGGVDSAVSALLLAEQGYDVVGVNLRTYDYEAVQTVACNTAKKSCCSPEDIKDARDTGLHLNIPFYVLRIEESFKKNVIDRFITDYKSGRTPNPCVECNTFVKFGVLFEKAQALGIQKIATGHYARVHSGDRYSIQAGKDPRKNQAYYLYGLSQDALANTIFPLGDMQKSEVRDIARSHGLTVAEKEESQEICFVPENDYRIFLKRQGVEFQPGYFKDLTGRIMGKHQGKEQFTIGQRKGLGISWSKPLYVVKIEENGDVILATDDDPTTKEFSVEQITFQGKSADDFKREVECRVQIRYRSGPVRAAVSYESHTDEISWNGRETGHRMRVRLLEPATAITPGQSAVFFPAADQSPNDIVLAGGIIVKE